MKNFILIFTHKFKIIFAIWILLLSESCSLSKVKVVVDSQDTSKHLIVFDEKDSLVLHQKNFTLQLSPGRHSFKIDQDSIQHIIVGNRGGLLNIDNQEYIGYTIEFESRQKKNETNFDMGMIPIRAFVLIDSFIVVNTPRCYKPSDEVFSIVYSKLQTTRNGNYLEMDDFNLYDTTREIMGLKKFGKNQLFINKFWDYDLDEEVPHSISITRSSDAIGKARSSRTAIVNAKIFIEGAKEMPAEFTLCSINDLKKKN